VIVLDTSAAVHYLVGAEQGRWVESRLEDDPDVHAPHLIDVEVAGTLRRLVRDRRVSEERARAALEALIDLDLARYSHVPLLPRMWELRANVSAADAAFVALAEILAASLVTTDRRLARATGIRAAVVTP
jgi:predicted nucleic acid-binding protein